MDISSVASFSTLSGRAVAGLLCCEATWLAVDLFAFGAFLEVASLALAVAGRLQEPLALPVGLVLAVDGRDGGSLLTGALLLAVDGLAGDLCDVGGWDVGVSRRSVASILPE